jgi:hypothetical protein
MMCIIIIIDQNSIFFKVMSHLQIIIRLNKIKQGQISLILKNYLITSWIRLQFEYVDFD